MRRTILSIFALFSIGALVLFSCRKEHLSPPNDCDDTPAAFIGYEVESVTPLGKGKEGVSKFNEILKSKGYRPDYSQSVEVTYKGLTLNAIYTPLTSSKETDVQTFLLYYTNDAAVSDECLFISREMVDEAAIAYTFHTVDEEFLCSFNVNASGIISNIAIGESNSKRPTTWSGCVKDALNAIANEPVVALACMWWGPYCAGGIAFMCLGVYQ